MAAHWDRADISTMSAHVREVVKTLDADLNYVRDAAGWPLLAIVAEQRQTNEAWWRKDRGPFGDLCLPTGVIVHGLAINVLLVLALWYGVALAWGRVRRRQMQSVVTFLTAPTVAPK
ncbi:MAG: hypothetical protein ACT4PL_07950 [Phycisphaerales bacterium]